MITEFATGLLVGFSSLAAFRGYMKKEFHGMWVGISGFVGFVPDGPMNPVQCASFSREELGNVCHVPSMNKREKIATFFTVTVPDRLTKIKAFLAQLLAE